MHVLWDVQSGQCGTNDDTSAPGLSLSCCLREWMACWKSLYKKQIWSGLFHYLFPSSLEEKALYKDTHQIFSDGCLLLVTKELFNGMGLHSIDFLFPLHDFE